MKNSSFDKMPFVFYPSFYDQLEVIKNDGIRLIVTNAIIKYGIFGIEPDFTSIDPIGAIDAMFIPIRADIDRAKARYFASVENGKKGGAPKGSRNNPNGRGGKSRDDTDDTELTQTNLNQPKLTPNIDKDIDKDIDTDKDKEEKKFSSLSIESQKKRVAPFSPPSIDDILDFILCNSLSVNVELFYDFYTSNGWMVGKNKMKDWQAAVRAWDSREKEAKKDKRKNRVNDEWATRKDASVIGGFVNDEWDV